jgi:hypothetical protein
VDLKEVAEMFADLVADRILAKLDERKKASSPAAPVSVEPVPAAPSPAAPVVPEQASAAVTPPQTPATPAKKPVEVLIQDVVRLCGRAAAVALLAEFGAKRVSDVQADRLEDFANAAVNLIFAGGVQ